MTGVLIREGNSTGAERKRLCEDRAETGGDAAHSPGHQEPAEAERGREEPPETSEEVWPCLNLDFELLASSL